MRKTRPLTVRRGAGPTSSGYCLRLSQSRPISRHLQGHSRCSPSLAGVSAHSGHHSVSVRRTEPLVTIWLRDPVDAARHSVLSCWGILLCEDGSGERYERPTRGFIQIPHELWTAGPCPQQRWYERLSLPALTFMALRVLAWGEGVEQGPVGFSCVEQDSGAVVVEVGDPERHALDQLGQVVGCFGGTVGHS